MLPFRKALQRWLLSRLPLEHGGRLGQRRIYLLPTRFGLLLLVVALAVWVGALNYAVSLAYALAFWIIGLMLVAVLMAYRQLSGLNWTVLPGEGVFVGQSADCRIQLDNDSALARRLQLRAGQGGEPLSCLLAASSSQSLALPLLLARRGRHGYPALQLWSTAPFGLMRAFAWLRPDGHVLAYPLPMPDRERNDLHSEQGSGRQSGDDEEDFSHLAEYRQGDTPRQIAWSVLARRDVLVSKRFASQPRGQSIRQLAWQDYPAAVDMESRLSRLCWRVQQCEKAGQHYRLHLPGVVIEPQPQQRELALAALAEFKRPS
ncbi:hypothetical protein DBR44_04225 [Aquitalea sp. FJL05]|uniref:DUF58 domain-containing protein n=1 Tax=Aquitalea TaxID=407217 RepID=UPI000F59859B|nr:MULTISPECIES: DUF58 domain-containing protein [Aquitalea]RQO76886.1 hypothetical protein DBR44_04225 [Aquitalea sp. FJL05]